MRKQINTTYTFEFELKKDGNYERKITIRREHHDPYHDPRHNEQVESLIEALGIPRDDASGRIKIVWEEISEPDQPDIEKVDSGTGRTNVSEAHSKINQTGTPVKPRHPNQKRVRNG